MNIADFLSSMVAITLDGSSSDECAMGSKQLVQCMVTAGVPAIQSKECILCIIPSGANADIEECDELEERGFCQSALDCARDMCTEDCVDKFETWGRCQLAGVGCPDICQKEVFSIA